MDKVAALFSEVGKATKKLKGRGFANFAFQGNGKDAGGLSGRGEMEIVDGLNGTEQIVTVPGERLAPGVEVQVLTPTGEANAGK